MKRKTMLAICSLRNSIGNVKRGSNTLWKKNYQQKMEMKWKSDKTGKFGKTREEGVQSEVVVWYECAKEHNS